MQSFANKAVRWSDVWHLIKPYWVSEEKISAWSRLIAIIALTLAGVYINVLINEWNRVFYDALQNHNYAVFKTQLIRFSYLAFFFIVIAIYRIYLTQGLQMLWRRWMTRHYMNKWLAHQAYYHTEMQQTIDNPDQRIAQDLNTLTDSTLSLILGLLSSLVTLGSFIAILWSVSGPLTLIVRDHTLTIPGYMVWFALLYAGSGSFIIWWMGRRLVGLNFNQERFEANFRFGLIRVRSNADAIALYHGETQEKSQLNDQFENIRTNWWDIMRLTRRLNVASTCYDQFAIIFPILVAAPRYFSNAIQLGTLMQIASAFGQVQGALSWFIGAFTDLAAWKSCVNRLAGFNAAIEFIEQQPVAIRQVTLQTPHNALELYNLSLALHDGQTLLNKANLQAKNGDKILIVGPSGCGKSTLLRAIAGVWPYGQGSIALPRDQRQTLFLPQKSYLPISTLRAALCYPHDTKKFHDDSLHEMLLTCRLGHLIKKLDIRANWGGILSPGEQQKLAFARALLIRPEILYLDEATSAMDEETEQHVYQLLNQHLPHTTLFSVAHRSSVASFHTLRWQFIRQEYSNSQNSDDLSSSIIQVSQISC